MKRGEFLKLQNRTKCCYFEQYILPLSFLPIIEIPSGFEIRTLYSRNHFQNALFKNLVLKITFELVSVSHKRELQFELSNRTCLKLSYRCTYYCYIPESTLLLFFVLLFELDKRAGNTGLHFNVLGNFNFPIRTEWITKEQ